MTTTQNGLLVEQNGFIVAFLLRTLGWIVGFRLVIVFVIVLSHD